MGTHIDGFLPYATDRSLEAVGKLLNAVFDGLQSDLALIRERGRFSKQTVNWWLTSDESTLTGEGPCGFSIVVYPMVIAFTSVERFGAIEHPDLGIHTSLRRVFETTAMSFGANDRLAVAAGGFGDTDRAADIAAGAGRFADVCGCLETVIGPPALTWDALETGAGNWYWRGHM
jgi:hypothetical protein